MGSAFSWIKKPFEFIVNTISDIVDLGVTAFKLGKEIVFAGVVSFKAGMDLLLDAFDLVASLIEFLDYISNLLTKYLHIPFIFVYLVPFFLFSGLILKFVNLIVSNI